MKKITLFVAKILGEFSKRVKKITPVLVFLDRCKRKKPAPNGRFLYWKGVKSTYQIVERTDFARCFYLFGQFGFAFFEGFFTHLTNDTRNQRIFEAYQH